MVGDKLANANSANSRKAETWLLSSLESVALKLLCSMFTVSCQPRMRWVVVVSHFSLQKLVKRLRQFLLPLPVSAHGSILFGKGHRLWPNKTTNCICEIICSFVSPGCFCHGDVHRGKEGGNLTQVPFHQIIKCDFWSSGTWGLLLSSQRPFTHNRNFSKLFA